MEKEYPQELIRKEYDDLFRINQPRYQDILSYYNNKIMFASADQKASITNEVLNTISAWQDNLVKELFSSIFTTVSGSYYFISKNGLCIRFKFNNGIFKEITCTENVFFIKPDKAHELLNELQLKQDGTYRTSNLVIEYAYKEPSSGLVPFEFRKYQYSTQIKYEFDKDNNVLKISGDEYGNFSSVWHIGHEIKNVIK